MIAFKKNWQQLWSLFHVNNGNDAIIECFGQYKEVISNEMQKMVDESLDLIMTNQINEISTKLSISIRFPYKFTDEIKNIF